MKVKLYREVLDTMRTLRSRDCVKQTSSIYPSVSHTTLGSIWAQDVKRRTRSWHRWHHQPERADAYYQEYVAARARGEQRIVLRLADQFDLSPALMARLILERHLATDDGVAPPKQQLTRIVRDPAQLDDAHLARELHICHLVDSVYGPIADSVNHSIGWEYEHRLERHLKEHNMAYLSEDQLRARGYDKTPDFKLEVPVAVEGRVINWIESKASFGDEESHDGYLQNQYLGYRNRFGAGLVIYWFGFLEELNVRKDKGIVLMDSFPSRIQAME